MSDAAEKEIAGLRARLAACEKRMEEGEECLQGYKQTLIELARMNGGWIRIWKGAPVSQDALKKGCEYQKKIAQRLRKITAHLRPEVKEEE